MIDLLKTEDSRGKEVVVLNVENITRLLVEHESFVGTFRFDVFKNRHQIKENEVWRNITDDDFIEIQRSLQTGFPFLYRVSKNMVIDSVFSAGVHNKIDSAGDYIKSIKWDKKQRLDTWLHEVYASPDDDIHKSIGANWIKGLVNRATTPGCRFDYVLVLIGSQGTRKSTSLATLACKDWYLETDGRIDKDFLQDMEGKLIVEFSEGETLNRTETTKLKSFITKPTDTYRPSYGRVSRDFPRRCVFAMTTNDQEFLKDVTGNRRWLPVETDGEVNIKWLEENREQLFAEAYHRITKKKETTWEFPEGIKEHQEERRIHDSDEERIVEWYCEIAKSRRELGIGLNEAYVAIFEPANPKSQIPWHTGKLLSNTLRHVLHLDNKAKRISKYNVKKRWFPTDKTPKPSPTATTFLSKQEVTDEEYDKNF